MSNRVHKIIGYGLADIKYKHGKICDPRINPDGFLGQDPERAEKKWKTKNYERWLRNRANGTKNLRHNTELHLEARCCETGAYFPSSIIYNPEMGLRKVLVIVPVSKQFEWCRYDDAIDHAEEASKETLKRWAPLRSIYPYIEVPETVKAVCEYAQLFTDKKFIEDLKPMLYVYWS